MKIRILLSLSLVAITLSAYAQTGKKATNKADTLPEPYATKSSTNFSNVVGWEDGETPIAPDGFKVTKYADGFDNPRWIYVAPNRDIFIAECNSHYSAAKKVGANIIGASKSNNLSKSADRITLLRDKDKDGIPEERYVFLETGLKQPFGMLILGNWFYVANTDAVVRFPYKNGQNKITGKGEKITDLAGGKRHWAKNIILDETKSNILISVGSGSNVAEDGMEQELMRACILKMRPDGSEKQIYASGLRNPVGMDFAPGTNNLYTVVNERDELGDELVPDYMTRVQKGAFYGWPYSYFGQHLDPRIKVQQPELVKKALVPDIDLGSHTASLGLVFYSKDKFPPKYRGGAFVAQHGSWNRSVLSGYKVVYVPFSNGMLSGKPEDFLTGFIKDLDKKKVHGRPVCVAVAPDGSLLVTDDVTNIVWRVAYEK